MSQFQHSMHAAYIGNFCWCGIIIGKKTQKHHHHHDVITIRAVQGNLILTQQDEIWKTTYIFLENGRQPQFFCI